ncbi:murein transglycosylase [Catenuloplanes sp. NPDC051500]|uniref:murein transglycosylase n=1 Tax=Catenuloplanes sp. NPDC051500 TaxID=3363959 RepID=UPI0037A94CF0
MIEVDSPDSGMNEGVPGVRKAAGPAGAAQPSTPAGTGRASEPEVGAKTGMPAPVVAAGTGVPTPVVGATSDVPAPAAGPAAPEVGTHAGVPGPVGAHAAAKPDRPVEPALKADEAGSGTTAATTKPPISDNARTPGDLAATKTDLPPVKDAGKAGDGAPAVSAAYGLARLTRRRLRPPGTPRHAAVPLNPMLRRLPAVHGMAQRSLDGAAAWRRSRWGRLTLPGLLLLVLLVAAGATGGYLVPAVAGSRTAAQPPPSTEPTPGPIDPTAAAPGPEFPVPPLVTGLPTLPGDPAGGVTPTAPVAGVRPADALAGWAQQVSAKSGIPPVAMQAYGYAEWVVGQRLPNCHLNWTTLAAIGKVESNHGRANGATLLPDGESNPPIQGLPLDGQGDRKLIPDTEQGRLDGDTTYDRAIGSMQFIPTTWAIWKADADNDGVSDPNDIDDAALAAGNYLCANGKDLATTEDWWNAILTYNNVEPYAQSVYEAANDFGIRSRT